MPRITPAGCSFFGGYGGLSDARAFAPGWHHSAVWMGRLCQAPLRRAGRGSSPLCRVSPPGGRRRRRLLTMDDAASPSTEKTTAKRSTRHKTMTLEADEFMRRFLLHVLPGGFHRIRHYGLLANAGRREHLAQVRQLCTSSPPHRRRRRRRGGLWPIHVRLPALRRRDDRRRDLRPRATDPRATHLASRSMSTGSRCPQRSVHFASATAESGRLGPTLPQHRFSPAAAAPKRALHVAIPHRRDASRRLRRRSVPPRPLATRQIPIAPCSPNRSGTPRFPPSRLVRRLPAWRQLVIAPLRGGRHRTTLNGPGHWA